MIKRILFFICTSNILIGTSACNNQTNTYAGTKDNYTIDIDYKIVKIPHSASNDTTNKANMLYISFESRFRNDSVKVSINGRPPEKGLFTTDESTACAGDIELKGIDTIKTVTIQVNNGPVASVKIDPARFFMGVRYQKNKLLSISFYSEPKLYD